MIFFKITDSNLLSVSKRGNYYDVSGEIFNSTEQTATMEYQKSGTLPTHLKVQIKFRRKRSMLQIV